MGYFPNGTAGMMYEEQWCARCLHNETCVVWQLHMMHNYRDCNDEKSMLHALIPRGPDGENLRCRMFLEEAT